MGRTLVIGGRDRETGRAIIKSIIPLPDRLDRRVQELLDDASLLPPSVRLVPLGASGRVVLAMKAEIFLPKLGIYLSSLFKTL